jgi:hypothetical protein
MQAVAHVRESTQVLMLSKKQWLEPRRMHSLWFGGVRVYIYISVSSLLLLSGQGNALRTENTAGGPFMAR